MEAVPRPKHLKNYTREIPAVASVPLLACRTNVAKRVGPKSFYVGFTSSSYSCHRGEATVRALASADSFVAGPTSGIR